MLLLQTTASVASAFGWRYCYTSDNLNHNSSLTLTKTPFLPLLHRGFYLCGKSSNAWRYNSTHGNKRLITPCATLLEAPVWWAGRLCIFYALLKSGLAGSPENPIVSDLESGAVDLGFSKWF